MADIDLGEFISARLERIHRKFCFRAIRERFGIDFDDEDIEEVGHQMMEARLDEYEAEQKERKEQKRRDRFKVVK